MRVELLALEHCWSISSGGPELSPSHYHLFTYLKTWSGSQRFNNNEEFMEGVKTWLRSQAENFFDIGIKELIPRYDKFFNSGGDYVEKQLKYVRFFVYSNFFLIACFLNSSPKVTFRKAFVCMFVCMYIYIHIFKVIL
jgi:hypothetical protein